MPSARNTFKWPDSYNVPRVKANILVSLSPARRWALPSCMEVINYSECDPRSCYEEEPDLCLPKRGAFVSLMVDITLTILWLSVKRGVGRPVNVCCSSQNHFWSFFLIVMEKNTFPKSKAATVFLRSYRSTLVKILHLIRELHFRHLLGWVWGVHCHFPDSPALQLLEHSICSYIGVHL